MSNGTSSAGRCVVRGRSVSHACRDEHAPPGRQDAAGQQARAAVQPDDDAWDLLNRLAKVYMFPDAEFPAPKGPGYIVRYAVDRIGGVGPWASTRH
jgi:hypothetical protein